MTKENHLTRYDVRGYGYFSLVKPDRPMKEELCPCGEYPASLCNCDEPIDYEDFNDDSDED